jgi:CheY-like chemotaxis protein
VGQLAGGIAHDFNNILTTIILFSQIATSRTDLPNSAREAIVNVLSEARRAARLVRQMLDFSRRTELEMQPLELGPFVDEVVDVLRRTLPRDVAVLVDVNSGEHWVCADHISLRQVLTNLALNARDAMPSGGTLSVELAHLDLGVGEAPPAPEMEPGAWVRLTVADTGSGIAPEDRAHLFEPFFTTKGPEGHGLGLAQVHGIIRQHGGQVGVETEVGAGTAFHVYLPRIEAQQAQTVEVGEEEVPRGAGETVLLVDDEEHVRESARRILSDLGYEVLVASRGGEALKILREVAEVDLVVAELTTPLGEGGTLVGELRKHKGVPPLLVLAGHNVSDVERQVLGYDVAVLSKPFKVAEFARALRRTLGRGA